MSDEFLAIYEEAEVDVPGLGSIGIDFFRINDQDLSGEIEKQAAYYAFWTTAEADAARDVANAKLQLKITTATVRRQVIYENPKLRVADIDAEVTMHPDVIGGEKDLIEAEHQQRMIKAISMALQQKKDMLSSKTGLMRTEMEVSLKEAGLKALGGSK